MIMWTQRGSEACGCASSPSLSRKVTTLLLPDGVSSRLQVRLPLVEQGIWPAIESCQREAA